MHESIEQREALWTRFLETWPLASLSSMTLEQYNQAGVDNSFCRWLEKHTESLGSIWGGSALKFGIYSRSNTSKEATEQVGVISDNEYAWYSKYGATAAEAFTTVRALLVQVAHAAQADRLDDIERVDLWPILKWKVAFLYQNRQQPCVLPIFLRKYLQAALGSEGTQKHTALYRSLLAQRGEATLLEYADKVYVTAQVALQRTEQKAQVLEHFKAITDLRTRLEGANAVQAFCDLAQALHQQGIDWWITDAGAIHAGRTEDFRVWQTVVVLRLDVRKPQPTVALKRAGTEDVWQLLDEALVDELVEAISQQSQLQPLTHRKPYWPDDYNTMDNWLVIPLTDGAIRNGYLSIPKLQKLFPAECWAEEDQQAQQRFQLLLPNGETVETQLLKKYNRMQARLGSLFVKEEVKPGDRAVISRLEDYRYQLHFMREGEARLAASEAAPQDGQEANMPAVPLNQILFGPPGTGKTYQTIDAALEVLAPESLALARPERKARFDEFVAKGDVRFVTFHQSFSYEDFVEGLRATTNESGALSYDVVDGVFKELCLSASSRTERVSEAPTNLKGRRIWKMSLGNTQNSNTLIYEQCLEENCLLLGYGEDVDFTGCKNRNEVYERFVTKGHAIANPNTDYGITSVTAFVTRMKPGDLVVVSDGNFRFRAIGEVTGEYAYKQHEQYQSGYCQYRPVKWLRTYSPSRELNDLMKVQFSQMTLYELGTAAIDMQKLEQLLASDVHEARAGLFVGQRFNQGYIVKRITQDIVELEKPRGGVLPLPMSIIQKLLDYAHKGQLSVEDIRQGKVFEKIEEAELEKYIVNGYQSLLGAVVSALLTAEAAPKQQAKVLIIDEINRGNVSRIFGELITLIEDSKRAGAEEALEVVLPYSKKAFSVPSNVYLIGTMNTADRSLAGLDIALRRRFTFKEMPPQPELLSSVNVERDGTTVNIGQLLQVMNQRIEVLLDRDHCLGHAYFMALKDEPTLEHLAAVLKNKVLPQLQEYFFEDWQRIQWVLNDHRKALAERFLIQPETNLETLFGSDIQIGQQNPRWLINEKAFESIEAFAGIIDHQFRLSVKVLENPQETPV